jgi:spore coat protein U-like protein
MKKFLAIAALGLAGAASQPAIASNVSSNVSVGITLNSACVIDTAPALSFTYTSFQSGAQAASSTSDLSFRCTATLPYDVSFQAASVSQTLTVPASAANLQLTYNLGLTGAYSSSGNGNTAKTVTVTGSMPASQSGTCATASCGPATQTIPIYVIY